METPESDLPDALPSTDAEKTTDDALDEIQEGHRRIPASALLDTAPNVLFSGNWEADADTVISQTDPSDLHGILEEAELSGMVTNFKKKQHTLVIQSLIARQSQNTTAPRGKKQKVRTGEQLEARLAMANDVMQAFPEAFIDNVKRDTYAEVADVLLARATDAQRGNLESRLGLTHAEMQTIATQLVKAQQNEASWKAQTPYMRSDYDASDVLDAKQSNLTKAQKKLIQTHKNVVSKMYTLAQQAINLEDAGKTKPLQAKMKALNNLIATYNNRTTQKPYAALGLSFPKNSAECMREVRDQHQQSASLRTDVLSLSNELQAKQAEGSALSAQISGPQIDLRPSAHILDGSTPEEVAAIDAALEQELSEDAGLNVTIDILAGAITDRARAANGGVTLQMTQDEFRDLAGKIGIEAGRNGNNIALTRETIAGILHASALSAGLTEYAEEQAVYASDKIRTDRIVQITAAAEGYEAEFTATEAQIASSADMTAEQSNALFQKRTDLKEKIHAARLFLLREHLAAAEKITQSSVVLSGHEWKEKAVNALEDAIEQIDASRQVDHIVPFMNISIYADKPGLLRLQPIYMPEGLAVRMGNATFPLTPGLEGQVYFVSLAEVSMDPVRKVYMMDLIDAKTGEVIQEDIAGFNVAGGKHPYTYENGYGDFSHTNVRDMQYIAYDYMHPLDSEALARRGRYVELLNSLQTAQGADIISIAGTALMALDPENTMTDPVAYLRRQITDERNQDAHEAAGALLSRIMDICNEKADTTTLTTFTADLNDRRVLLQEADVLTSLMSARGTDPAGTAAFRTSYELLKNENDHMLESIRMFIISRKGQSINADEYDLFLRNVSESVDLRQMTSQQKWAGAVTTHPSLPLTVSHIKHNGPVTISMEDNQASLNLPSMLSGIDLSQYAEMVTGVRLRLSYTGNAPTVIAYRDSTPVGTFTPDADGIIQILDLEGLTHLLVNHDAASTASLDDISVLFAEGMPNDKRLALGAGTSREIAMMMAPDAAAWKSTNVKYTAGVIDIDPTKYTRVSVHGYEKDATIRGISYFNGKDANDRARIPDEFITKLDAHTWLIHPGTPRQLYVEVDGAKVYYRGRLHGYSWEFDLDTDIAANPHELIRTGPMNIDFNRMDFDAANSDGDYQLYWMDRAPSYIQSRGRVTGTGEFWFRAFVTNTGSVGGTVKIDLLGAASNYDPANPGPIQRSISAHFDPGAEKLLHGWATIPRTGDSRNGSIMARITYPDGRIEYEHIAYTSPPREMSFASRSVNQNGEIVYTPINPYSPEEQERILRAHVKLADALRQQGDTVNADRVINGLPIATSGGAGTDTIAIGVKTQIAALGVEVLPTTYATEDVKKQEEDMQTALQKLLEGTTATSIAGDLLPGIMREYQRLMFRGATDEEINAYARAVEESLRSGTSQAVAEIRESIGLLNQRYFEDVNVETYMVAGAIPDGPSPVETDKALYKQLYDEIDSILDEMHWALDTGITAFNNEIKRLHDELEKNDHTWGQTVSINAAIGTLAIGRDSLKLIKFPIPNSPEGLGIEVAMTASGLAAMKYGSKFIGSSVTKIDNLLGTSYGAKFGAKINAINEGANELIVNVQRRMDINFEFVAWQKFAAHAIEDHIGVPVNTLKARGKLFASSFTDNIEAAETLAKAQSANSQIWKEFLTNPDVKRVELSVDSDSIGYGVEKLANGQYREYIGKHAKFIFVKHRDLGTPFNMTIEIFP